MSPLSLELNPMLFQEPTERLEARARSQACLARPPPPSQHPAPLIVQLSSSRPAHAEDAFVIYALHTLGTSLPYNLLSL